MGKGRGKGRLRERKFQPERGQGVQEATEELGQAEERRNRVRQVIVIRDYWREIFTLFLLGGSSHKRSQA